jgi:hypothetical protein
MVRRGPKCKENSSGCLEAGHKTQEERGTWYPQAQSTK